MKNTMKALGLFMLLACTFSCSDSNPVLPEEPPGPTEYDFKVDVSKTTLNVFEATTLDLNFYRVKWHEDIEWTPPHDSVIVTIPDVLYDFHNFIPGSSSNHTLTMGQGFAEPGEYTLYARGYKDDELIDEISQKIIVKPAPNDFLMVKWGEETPGINQFVNSWHEYNLTLQHRTEHYEHAVLEYRTRSGGYNEWRILRGYEILRDAMIANGYGEPEIVMDLPDFGIQQMREEYNKRFLVPVGENMPIEIWDTDGAHIALYKVPSPYDVGYYEIIAEPRKF